MKEKFQKLFDSMKLNDKVTVELDLYEVGRILSMVKSVDAYEQSLEDNMLKNFEKSE
ncbi:hypothetical protein IFU39_16255 [Paenibacillus sp. CFBP 13594]|uniref:hypothetical protein n=1 Tax=Paenibacillus sp. CFBP 13594 TaxID=2774037 RepID=UPI0017825177|nr:hypothetical protein [Paenibacillus sp. CFBP 13594]MBD8839365.1 hypothetical protein [Paenibacillus sp. CFBP 13594]